VVPKRYPYNHNHSHNNNPACNDNSNPVCNDNTKPVYSDKVCNNTNPSCQCVKLHRRLILT
jgi:hypothetical protein